MEFLEVIARIAKIYFRDSEMHAKSLKWKLNYILEKVYSNTVQMKINEELVEIEEFSDSDDDYWIIMYSMRNAIAQVKFCCSFITKTTTKTQS